MKKETVLLVVIAVVVGLLVGILVSKSGRPRATLPAAGPTAPTVNTQEQIRVLQDLVAREPGNRNAWVQLGHLYFDTNQSVQSVEAYNRALALDPNDPDVLTDQGIMFRQLGWFDKAIENFNQASRINPNHPQSLFNLGVVYRYDLNDFPAAIEAWNRFLQITPTGPGADQIRAEINFMQSHPQTPGAPSAPGGR
ncbi:MAG: tetratricopeptide repeat protein [Desulfuromonadales bacterium]|nr:tetratricopeptide repeat protein [Desulfuromonadales bacterium]